MAAMTPTDNQTAAPTRPRAFFLPVDTEPGGQRLCLLHAAQGAALGSVLYGHPFAEEMSKSRRRAGLQARALARAGYDALQIDLPGCGGSSGDFGDASQQDVIWCEVSGRPDASLSPAAAKAQGLWRQAGISINSQIVDGAHAQAQVK